MAASPLSPRAGVVSVWTGSRMLIWGGFRFVESDEVKLADGAAYDPSTDRWTPLPSSPLTPRSASVGVWDGHQLLVWGGEGVRCCEQPVDGAAFDPARNRWTSLPPSPLPSKRAATASGVWTGKELVIWCPDPGVGAAYDPSTRRWRRLPAAPLRARSLPIVVWDGREMIVAGGFVGETTSSAVFDGAAYDPTTDRWRPVPTLPAWPEDAVSTGGGVIVRAHRTDLPNGPDAFLVLDDHGNGWRALPDPPQSVAARGSSEPDPPDAVLNPRALLWTGRELLVPGWFGPGLGPSDEGGAAFDLTTNQWRILGTGGQSSGGNGAYAWTGTELLEWGGQGWGAGVTENEGFAFHPAHA